MDLTRLPVSLSKVRSADKAGIEKDRKQFWDKLFEKVCFKAFVLKEHFYFMQYERLSEMETEEEAIDEIDHPINVLNRERAFRCLSQVPGSKTFRKWVADHGEEIDECMDRKIIKSISSFKNINSSDNLCGAFRRG